MKLFLYVFLLLFATGKALANPACAVCTVAIGASLEIARRLGVDDCVVGVWTGAMLAIIGYWTIRWFAKKGWTFKGYKIVLMISSVATVGFVYMGDLIYEPAVIGFLYLDSFLFTSILGALVLIMGMHFYQWMKAKNGGHAHFPFEKVAVPVLMVLLTSLVINYYPVCNCNKSRNQPVGADISLGFD